MNQKRKLMGLGPLAPHPAGVLPGRDDSIYRTLYTAIVENHLGPGTKLPEDSLAASFEVSRTSIRKVLQRLSCERLVDLRLNRGATVAQPGVREAREIFAARRIIECGALPLALERLTPMRLDDLRRMVQREREAALRGDRREAIYLSGRFHVELLKLSGNQTLEDLLSGLVARSSLVIATFGTPLAGSCRHSEHDDVIALLAARDRDAAVAWMERHLHEVERSVALVDEDAGSPDLKAILAGVARRTLEV